MADHRRPGDRCAAGGAARARAGAPGKEAGLDATVAWVAATYPDIDLDSPPTYPASGSTGGAW